MKLYSDAFLNDSYLKYVGWTLHDKVSHQAASLLCTVKHEIGPTLLVARNTTSMFNFTRFWFASSKVKCGWSVWLRYKACFITENLVCDWNFSQVALRWASSFSANYHSLSITWLIKCRDIVWNVPLFLHYRTELCLWLWIRSMTLPCRPSDYWHLCYSQYSPSSTLLQYMIDKASCLNCNISHINSPFKQDLFLPWWRDFFILSPQLIKIGG